MALHACLTRVFQTTKPIICLCYIVRFESCKDFWNTFKFIVDFCKWWLRARMSTGLDSVGLCGPHRLWHSTWEERIRKKNGIGAINLMQKRMQKRLFYCFHKGKSWIWKYVRKRRWKEKMKNIFFLSLCSRISKIKLSMSYYFYWKIWRKNPYTG